MNNNLRITKLKLSNYRNHKFLTIEPDKDIILISGKNGAGKTNILESISLFDSSSGFRNAYLSELIYYGLDGPCELFGVNINLEKKKEYFDLGIGIKKREEKFKKVITFNSKKQNTLKKNILNIFWIIPQMSHLFQSRPEDRRVFLDSMISTIDFSYKKKLSEYKKCKNERLRILKNSNHSSNDKWLDIIERKMSEYGILICDARRIFLKSLNKSFNKIDDQIPVLNLKLNGEVDELLDQKPALAVEDFILERLKKNRIKDSISGRTNFSVDRTDLLVFDRFSEKEAKSFSTGEQKIIIISIIFSFLNVLEKVEATKIIFLLDDIFSYLDNRYIRNIIIKLKYLKFQTWITDIRMDAVNKIEKFQTLVENINIDDYRFKVTNNKL